MNRTAERADMLPHWVRQLFGELESSAATVRDAQAFKLSSWEVAGPHGWQLTISRVERVQQFNDEELKQAIANLYRTLQRTVPAGWQAVRFWNFIPDIHRIATDGIDRYMIFNAGRHRAIREWFGSSERFDSLPTATAVGHDGDHLHVFCLASDQAARAIENPRQRPAYHYSERYGPLPPCFSRATVVETGNQHTLMIGGTASVIGEESRHPQNSAAQVDEIFINLELLVEAASGGQVTLSDVSHDVRVYCRRQQDVEPLAATIRPRFDRLDAFDLVQAPICRHDLLVEIEVLCRLPAPRSHSRAERQLSDRGARGEAVS